MWSAPASPSTCPRIPSVTPSRRTCWKAARTCEPSKRCSATPTSRRPRSTRTWTASTYGRFTYNLVQYLGELGAVVDVRRNDEVTVDEIGRMRPDAIVLSPGPCAPAQAGVTVDTIRRWGAEIPMLGVCLGHQAIGEAYGGRVVRARRVMHGKTSRVVHTQRDLFGNLPNPMEVM